MAGIRGLDEGGPLGVALPEPLGLRKGPAIGGAHPFPGIAGVVIPVGFQGIPYRQGVVVAAPGGVALDRPGPDPFNNGSEVRASGSRRYGGRSMPLPWDPLS
jgi:hypothetical protein